jgi:L-fucose isomerase-like protein
MFLLCKKRFFLFIVFYLNQHIILEDTIFEKCKFARKNMKIVKIGYVALSKASWITPKIEAIAAETKKALSTFNAVEVICPENLVSTETEAEKAANKLRKAEVDLLVMHFVSFPVGALIPCIANRSGNIPVVLLSNPEKPGAEKMWEQNSFCGANLGAFVMRRLGKKYGYIHELPVNVPAKISKYVQAVRCIKAQKTLRIGLAGGRVPGFYTSNFNEMDFSRKFGVTVELMELLEVVDKTGKLTAEELTAARAIVKRSSAGCNNVSEADLELGAKMYGAFKALADKYRIGAYSVRCWPELPDIFGIAPCAVLGCLSDNGIPAACEGDVPGIVTMMMLQTLADKKEIPFFVDLISFDNPSNTGVIWHCGAAPISLCRKFTESSFCQHMRVDGGNKKGLTNEFSLKAGRVTIAKLDQDIDGHFRMLILPATAQDTEPFLRGNPLRVKFDSPAEQVIETIMNKGFEHHYAVIHADVAEALEIYSKWMDFEIVKP